MTDRELQSQLQRMKAGDKHAFQRVYEFTHQHVYRTVYFLANNKQDVDDIMSEVYLELFKSVSNYNMEQPFRSWLNGLIVRQASSWHRKVWKRFRIFNKTKQFHMEGAQEELDERLLKNEDSEQLLALVDSLSYRLKEVVVLRYYQEHTFEEIAQLLDIPVGTVKSRHRLAIQKLRDLKGYTKNKGKEATNYVS